MSLRIRPGRDADAESYIRIVSECWDEYPGCVTDIDGEAPELRALATHMQGKGGAVWAAEIDGAVAGLLAAWPARHSVWEVGKMYVAAPYRGNGTAHALLDAAEERARQAGATEMVLWSDTRFTRAHAFYERRSYVRSGPLRALGDKSNSVEFKYAKPLSGVVVRTLDVAAIGSAEARLAAVLKACVDCGASVSFMPPMPVEDARAFWHRAGAAIAERRWIVLAAWDDGVLAGTVTLNCDTPPNQTHRAEVQKLLVHPDVRRHGVARRLMTEAERVAAAAGRTLLTLDTRAGDAAEPLYRAMRYVEAGRLPGYALNADGTPCETVIFYKTLPPAPDIPERPSG